MHYLFRIEAGHLEMKYMYNDSAAVIALLLNIAFYSLLRQDMFQSSMSRFSHIINTITSTL